jgi:hypothetical protein
MPIRQDPDTDPDPHHLLNTLCFKYSIRCACLSADSVENRQILKKMYHNYYCCIMYMLRHMPFCNKYYKGVRK